MGTLAATFMLVSSIWNLPPGLISALCYVESGHNANAIHRHDGHTDSLGVCQIKFQVAKGIGFKGTASQLQTDPYINAYFAAKLLHRHLVRYSGDPRKAIAAYNAGRHRVNDQGLTKNRKYVGKVFRAWAENK